MAKHPIKQDRRPTGDGAVVLLVDDQVIVAEAVRRMLAGEADIDYYFCTDPSQALELADSVKPTVILQDLVMPDIDGISLVRTYRNHSATANVPIIVLSNKDEPTDKSEAFAAGASDYLVKLPDRIELVARIRAHSKSYRTQMDRDAAYQELSDLQKELQRNNDELQRLSCLDSLTGIANRRRFDDFIDQELMRAARERTSICIALVDVDHFKAYNDGYGHQQGDRCLKQIACALTDVVNRPADLVARYGGEEFVVVLPDTPLEGAAKMAEALRKKVESLKLVHEQSPHGHVTVSVGLSCVRGVTDPSPRRLLEAADQGLYEAKRKGRNRVMVATAKGVRRGGGRRARPAS